MLPCKSKRKRRRSLSDLVDTLIARTRIGGSVVECSPATRAARVRFPADAAFDTDVRPATAFFHTFSFLPFFRMTCTCCTARTYPSRVLRLACSKVATRVSLSEPATSRTFGVLNIPPFLSNRKHFLFAITELSTTNNNVLQQHQTNAQPLPRLYKGISLRKKREREREREREKILSLAFLDQ